MSQRWKIIIAFIIGLFFKGNYYDTTTAADN